MFDLKKYNFTEAETGISDFSKLGEADRQRLLYSGIDVSEQGRSGSFLHMNHEGGRCQSSQPGLELMNIKDALQRFDGLPQYYWKLLNPDQDEISRSAAQNLHGGYFIRAKKGAKITEPVQSCLFIKGNGVGQNVHNLIIVEEGAELNIISGCATAEGTSEAAHLGISELYVEKGGKLTFTMIHNWGENVAVRPRSAGVVAAEGSLVNNYVLLQPVHDVTMYPTISLNGENAVARFNSVIVAPAGSYVDTGNRLLLNAPGTRGEIIARTLTTGGTIINRGFIGGYAAPAKGHLECKGLVLGEGRIHAIPELDAKADGVELSHEAAVGKIAQEEIEYLMARGLDEGEATSTIVRGFLNVDIMGLPKELQKAMDDEIQRLNAAGGM
ncbi:MAG: SufD family Fe-S cluster assembly protein [Deltaproteobacteria bacterium]|jgi:Fe-S cluster assembly scaffold protein SufB|nr:SufD family Fe-S cluster assembly protein [Deltaproteobacteria bacterium]